MPVHVRPERLFKRQVGHAVAVVIKIEQAVETDAHLAGHESAHGSERLESAASAETYNLEPAQLRLQGAGVEVNVRQRIQLVQHNVNIVASDTGGNDRNAFAPEGAGHGAELAAADIAFTGVKMSGHHRYTPGVAHEYHLIGHLSGLHVQMENTPIGIDNQF